MMCRDRQKKYYHVLFLGDDGSLIADLARLPFLKIIGIVADRQPSSRMPFFGSSWLYARKHNIPVVSQRRFSREYRTLMKNQFRDTVFIFSQGFRYRLRRGAISKKTIRSVNFHQSLLPRYRGRHPLNWALICGETATGITFHYMNATIDGGDIIVQKKVRISTSDTVISLYKKTVREARRVLPLVIRRVLDDTYKARRQNERNATYFPVRSPRDGELVPADSCEDMRNKIRALVYPYPGAFVVYQGKRYVVDSIRRVAIAKSNQRPFIVRKGKRIIIQAADGCVVGSIRR